MPLVRRGTMVPADGSAAMAWYTRQYSALRDCLLVSMAIRLSPDRRSARECRCVKRTVALLPDRLTSFAIVHVHMEVVWCSASQAPPARFTTKRSCTSTLRNFE